MRKLKLIWDFRGPDALKIAKHHTIHLKEYAENQTLIIHEIHYKAIQEFHAIAFMIVNEENMKYFRDQLKPQRGEWVEN